MNDIERRLARLEQNSVPEEKLRAMQDEAARQLDVKMRQLAEYAGGILRANPAAALEEILAGSPSLKLAALDALGRHEVARNLLGAFAVGELDVIELHAHADVEIGAASGEV